MWHDEAKVGLVQTLVHQHLLAVRKRERVVAFEAALLQHQAALFDLLGRENAAHRIAEVLGVLVERDDDLVHLGQNRGGDRFLNVTR